MDAARLKSLCNAIARLQRLIERNWKAYKADPFDSCGLLIAEIRQLTKPLKILWLVEKLDRDCYTIATPPPNNKASDFYLQIHGTEAVRNEAMRCSALWIDWLEHYASNDLERLCEQPSRQYSVSDLKEITGLENTSLQRHYKQAGVTGPGRGKKNHKFSQDETVLILKAVAGNSSDRKAAKAAKAAIEKITS